MKEEMLFARRASGLVRAFSAFDALNLNISMCSPPQGVLWAWTWGASMFMSVHLGLSYFLGIFAVGLGAATVYAIWTLALPRSGGDYVWFSRAVHPAFGFAINWFLTFVFLNWFAMNSQTLGPFFLAPILLSLGMSNAADFASSLIGSVIIGTVYNILIALLLLFGSTTYVKFYRVIFGASLAGSVIYMALLLGTPHEAFVTAFNKAVTGIDYQGVIETAKSFGWIPGWTLTATLFGLVFPFQNYSWAGFPAYVGGEIRKVEKAAWIGMIGGLLAMGAWYVALGETIYHTAGFNFHSALTWLWVTHSEAYPLKFPPYPQNYALILTSNTAILLAISIGWFLSAVYLNPPNLLLATRNVFAWSFDRILPTRLSKVSARFRAPVYTILACAIVGELLTIFVAYTTYAVMIVNTFMVMEAVLFMVAIASLLFPYKKKEMFEKFPEGAKKKVLGIPLLSISGAIMAVFSGFMVYAAYSAPALGGLDPISFAFNIAMLLIAVPIFGISYVYNKRKGINLSLLFKEIPPE